MAEGWISLHRKLQDNPLWFSEPFTKGQAWVDLLLIANHTENYFYKRGVKIDLKIGQVGWSELALSARWKWSRNKVRKFLKELEKEHQITQQKSNVTQVVTILNYEYYQEKGHQTKQQKDTKRTPKGHQKDTNNNVNNVNNEKNIDVFNFKKSLLDLGIQEKVLSDWLKVRKAKKAVNTETAFNAIKSQLEKAKATPTECIKIAVQKSWSGFNAEWLTNEPLFNPPPNTFKPKKPARFEGYK